MKRTEQQAIGSGLALLDALGQSLWGLLTFNLPMHCIPHKLNSTPLLLSLGALVAVMFAIEGALLFVILTLIACTTNLALWKATLEAEGQAAGERPYDQVSLTFVFFAGVLVITPIGWFMEAALDEAFAHWFVMIWLSCSLLVHRGRILNFHAELRAKEGQEANEAQESRKTGESTPAASSAPTSADDES